MPSYPASFYLRTREARKIIVVDLGFLGDSVHLIPALWEIKRHYPKAELHTLSAPVGREVLALAPCVDRAWAYPLGTPSPPWWRHWNIVRELRRERFDLAVNFSGADRTIFLTALTGARWRLACQAGRSHFWNSWLIRDWIPRAKDGRSIFEQRRQVLEACGMSLGLARFDLQIPDSARTMAERIAPAGTIHFSINASAGFKEWPLENWAALAARLLREDAGRRIVATGSAAPRERARLEQLAKLVNDPRLTIGPTQIGVAELVAILARCRLHVGGDSGVLHLALVAGIPTLGIFRDYPGASEWQPVGRSHRHVQAPCTCVDRGAVDAACLERSACLALIAPESVAAHVADLTRLR